MNTDRTKSDEVPSTWCVVECKTCSETWTVDVAEFTPELTIDDVEQLLEPLLFNHDVTEHNQW